MEENQYLSEPRVRDLENNINEDREQLNAFFKKFRIINLVVLLVTFAAVAISFTLLFPLGQDGLTIGLVISIVFLFGAMLYMRLMKKNITKKGNVYINSFYKATSDFVYGDLNLENYSQEVANQLTMEDFTEARILKDVTRFGARNLVSYRLGKYEVKLSDYAAYQFVGKQNKIVFAGKLIVIDNVKAINGRVLIYRKPDQEQVKNASGPSDIEDLKVYQEDEDIVVYLEKDEDQKAINKKLISAVMNFKRELPFVDMTLSFTNEKLTIAISYDDELMAIPLPTEFSAKSILGFKRDLEAIHDLIKLL